MVVWIAWWACVDALFHVLFHTRPPMVVSDVCQCVFHTQITTKHSAVQLVHHPSTLHLANHQHHAFLHPTHQSITLLPRLSFLLLNVVFIVIIFVTIERVYGCDGMHHSFAPIINTLCLCHFGAIQCGHHFALVFWQWCLLFTTPLCFTHTLIWTVDVVVWHPRDFTQLGKSEGEGEG